ncbi:MAG: flagellar basal body rod protein FlgB [Acidobacteria bacterium]|nr:flagellar basal body rod protein FlgB [Planctomycetota bacterium]MBE3133630.1 flagellar basal body rod protein FlgB [Acidobacteriota bacterium]
MAQSARVAEYLETGLQAASLRQSVIAHNIANVGTPGFRRSTVPFERVFAEAMAGGKPVDREMLLGQIVQPHATDVNEFGSDVEIEGEIGDLIKNSMRYKAYARLLSRMYRQMELAMSANTP